MQGLNDLSDIELQRLPAEAAAAIARMRRRIEQQAGEIERRDQEIERKDREIAWRDARLEKIHLELARLKRWKFGARPRR